MFIKIYRIYDHTNEIKEKISKSRKEFLLNNPDKHPWKDKFKSKSFPCEYLKQKLLEKKIIFESEYFPIKDRNFSIDIAFVDKKIAIEINGNFHYDKTGELKEYYKNRHELIKNAGWTIYEIRYNHAFGDRLVNDIISDITKLDSEFYKKYIKKPNIETCKKNMY